MTNRETLKSLIQSEAYRYAEEPFKLASGKMSNHYFNCKTITLHPERLATLAAYTVNEHIPSFLNSPPESVGGLTLGADPVCYAISLHYSSTGNLVYPLIVRKEAKDHGTGKQIEGFADQIKSCLVVDDVITTGGSTMKAVDALRKAGKEITKAICIIDREEGGRELLQENGIELFPLFTKSDFK